MEHIIYKTINLLNGRFYIGMHSTSNEDDGYLGSGRRIKAEIKKHGRENFSREILFRETSRKALEEREAMIVNEELMQNPLCLNLKNGGEGGGRKWSEEHQRIRSSAGGKVGGRILKETKVGIFADAFIRPPQQKKVTDEQLLQSFEKNRKISKTLLSLGLARTGGSRRRLERLLVLNGDVV